jgi:hypothetical protein
MADLRKAKETYAALAAKAREGDKQAFRDKAKAAVEVRQIERELNAQPKRSLQEEYVRKFDDKTPVVIQTRHQDGTPYEFRGTLREYHANRLLKR